jgi:hypothetical protein
MICAVFSSFRLTLVKSLNALLRKAFTLSIICWRYNMMKKLRLDILRLMLKTGAGSFIVSLPSL